MIFAVSKISYIACESLHTKCNFALSLHRQRHAADRFPPMGRLTKISARDFQAWRRVHVRMSAF